MTAALFAVPAWAQSEGLEDNGVRDADTDENDNDLLNNDTATEPDNIDLIEILNAENCEVERGALIVFRDTVPDDRFAVIDGINARISGGNGDEIEVRDDNDEEDDSTDDEDIEFLNLETEEFQDQLRRRGQRQHPRHL